MRTDRQSPSARRAWIEIAAWFRAGSRCRRRPPRGGRGLKWEAVTGGGATTNGRPPRGGRGLKFADVYYFAGFSGRPPRGGRGLKYELRQRGKQKNLSPSARRAWIEIGPRPAFSACRSAVALREEGVD